jgi:hypothetical protein
LLLTILKLQRSDLLLKNLLCWVAFVAQTQKDVLILCWHRHRLLFGIAYDVFTAKLFFQLGDVFRTTR